MPPTYASAMRMSAILLGVSSLCGCARHGEPPAADDSDPVGPADTGHTDAAETDTPVDSDHTDTPEDTDPIEDTDTWRWGADNDADDADATLVGTTGEFAGACLLGVDDVDGNGGDDLLVAAPYADEHRGRAYLVAGRTGGWSRGEAIGARPYVQGRDVWDELCGGRPGDYDGDGLTDVLFDLGYNYTDPGGTFPLVRGGTWSVPNTPEARLDDVYGADTLFADARYSIGDVDGDGLEDAWLAASYDGGEALIVPGASLHGDVNAPDEAILWVAADPGRRTTFSRHTGDVDGDGARDIVAWYREEDPLYGALIVPGRDVGNARMPLAEPPTTVVACVDVCKPEIVGDIDGDGMDDVWVGEGYAGYVFLGRSDWPDALELGDADHFASGLGPLAPVGDVNSDGHGDFAQISGGPVYDSDLLLWFGGAAWPEVLDAAGADVVIAGGMQPGGIWRDPSGRVPDVDGDGIADLVVGNGGATVGGVPMAGAISVFAGREVWPATLTSAEADVRFVGRADSDWMGMYLYEQWTAFADLDADGRGRDDLVALDRSTGETLLFFGRPR
jgi:hypothetical protein